MIYENIKKKMLICKVYEDENNRIFKNENIDSEK